VKPFNKGQKNDYNDAEAIAEAALRPNLKTVSEKTQDQLDLQALHRVRARLVSRRTATINQIRAFLIEHGITVRRGVASLRNSLSTILENRRDALSLRMRKLIVRVRDRVRREPSIADLWIQMSVYRRIPDPSPSRRECVQMCRFLGRRVAALELGVALAGVREAPKH
jgi:transposase